MMKSPCNVDANENLPSIMLAVRVYLWWAGGCKRRNVAQACVDEQGATVRLVDHSGMSADAMTKKNGSVSLLQAHLHH